MGSVTTQRSPLALLSRGATLGAALLAGAALLTGCAAGPSSAASPAPAVDAKTAQSPDAATNADGGTTADRSDATTEKSNEDLISRLIAETFPDPTSTAATSTATALIAADAIAHGNALKPGPTGLLDQFAADHARVSGAQAVITHVAADGDLVAVHWQIAPNPSDERTGEAAVDLFRVSDGKVTERWSFDQPIPTGTPASGNTNTMFSDLYQAPAGTTAPTEAQEETNRQLAVGAYNALFRDKDTSVLDTTFDPAYLQHNSVAANGTAALKAFFASGVQFPPQQSVISLADGDLVWTFSQSVGAKPTDPYLAADIFRVDGGLIREHWDVVPATPGS